MTDLTTLASVKAWLNETNSNNDQLLVRLIRQASVFVSNYTNRLVWLPTAVTETRDGSGGDTMVMMRSHTPNGDGATIRLRRWPVLSIAALTINGQAIPVATALVYAQPPPDGYILDPWDGTIPGNAQFLSISGSLYAFDSGLRNVTVSYVAGYQVTAEPATVPAGSSQALAALQPMGRWGSDGGVTYANGTALTAVASPTVAGQYSTDGSGNYNFSPTDAGAAVLLTYGFIPSDIEQAAIELVGERFSYRSRIGLRSESLAGQEVTAYSLKDIPDYVRATLDQYRTPVIA